MELRILLIAGTMGAFVFVPVARAADTPAQAPGADVEQTTGTTLAGPLPTDTLKTGMDHHCKEILANQAKHSKEDVTKCGEPSK